MFISEPITVKQDKGSRLPVEFIWRGKLKIITRVISEWQDWGFSSGVHKADWKQRRHRNYFRVENNDNKIYEIYMDRKTSEKPDWFLYSIIDES